MGHFYAFKVSSLGQGTEWWIILWVAKISNIFLGVLEIPDIFGCMVDAGPEPTYEEKMRVPPPPPGYIHAFEVNYCVKRYKYILCIYEYIYS